MANYQETSNYSYIGNEEDVLGGLPVAQANKSYIAIFRGVVDSTPEKISNASFFITYLVDEDGNVSKISEDSFAQTDIQYTFAEGDNVDVIIDQGTLLNPQLAGSQQVSGVGSFIPILVSQTGSSINANVNNLQYLNPGAIPPEDTGETIRNFVGALYQSGSTNITPTVTHDEGTATLILDQFGSAVTGVGPQIFKSESVPAAARSLIPNLDTWLTASSPDIQAASWSLNPVMTNVPAGLAAATGSYKLNNTVPSITSINFRFSYGLYNLGVEDAVAKVGMYYRNPGEDWQTVQNIGVNPPFYTVTLPGATIAEGSPFLANVELITGSAEWILTGNQISSSREYLATVSSVQVASRFGGNTTVNTVGNDNCGNVHWATQDQIIGTITTKSLQSKWEVYAQNPGIVSVASQLPFFTTGSLTSTVLTGSAILTGQYGNFQTLPTASADFGFSPINFPFEVKIGDKIRFGYESQNIFTVYAIAEPPASSRLFITLDREIGDRLNINNFVIYRNLADGKFLTLDVAKNDPQIGEIDFTGVIIPQYASQKLQENASTIVAKLKSEGVLAEE